MEFDLILRFNIHDPSMANNLKFIIIMTRAKKKEILV